MNNKDTFCIFPWMHLTIHINGTIKICCNTYQKLDGLNFGYNKIANIWNGSEISSIRNNMINGIKVSNCEGCYFVEKLGHISDRTNINDQPRWKNVKVDNNPKILFLDFKLSNQCNLKCRMCNPYSSSLLEKEYNTSTKSGIQIPKTINNDQSSIKWQQTDIFWENLEEILPHLQMLKFTGGEPTIDNKVYKILEYCIDKGYNKHIKLKITTNGTNLNEKFRNLMVQFCDVIILVSVDAIGKVGEYIRYPMDWGTINKNISKLSTLPNLLSMGISSTIQVLNIYDLFDLLNWFKDLDHNILNNKGYQGITLVTKPIEYNITRLPNEILDKAIKKLEKLPFHSAYNEQYIYIMNILKNIDRNDRKNTDEFFVLNDYYDLIRKQKLNNVCLELYTDLIKYKTKD